MTITNEPDDLEWVAAQGLTRREFSDAPVPGTMVMFRHEGGDFPALVSDRRVNIRFGRGDSFSRYVESAGTLTSAIFDQVAALDTSLYDVAVHLTVFRPGAIDWRWATRGDGPRQWYSIRKS